MKTSVIFSLATFLSSVSTTRLKECIPESADSPLVDDVPAIAEALRECGSGQQISLPRGKSYTILSPIDFSHCKNCTFKILGSLNFRGDYGSWKDQPGMLQFANVDGATVVGDLSNSIVLGNFQPGRLESNWPPVIRISHSRSLSFSNLVIKNPPATAIEIDDFSSVIKLVSTKIIREALKEKYGYAVRVTNSTDITVKGITSSGTWRGIIVQSGVHNMVAEDIDIESDVNGIIIDTQMTSAPGEQRISNILLRRLRIAKAGTATGIITGNVGRLAVTNVTWQDVQVTGVSTWAEMRTCIGGPKDCCVGEKCMGVELDLRNVIFRNYTGDARLENQKPVCTNTGTAQHFCDITLEEINLVKSIS